MTSLKLFLFGPPRVELNGIPVNLQRRKALALLAYLAVGGQPYSRDALATLFWPDYTQSQARAYLRRDLAVLNTSLPGEWLVADREIVELKLTPDLWVDVAEFGRLLAACRSHAHSPEAVCTECLPLLTEAVTLYTDDFLAGFTLRDCPEFDDWQFFQTESLRQNLATMLERLVRGYSSQGDYEALIPYARRWLALDPLHEPAQRQLIYLYDQAGQPAAALRQYEEYVKLLEEELGLPPEEETTTLYEAIKAKRMLGSFLKAEEQRNKLRPEPSVRSSVLGGTREQRAEVSPISSSPHPQSEPPRPTLPSPPGPLLFNDSVLAGTETPVFVARQQELTQLETFLEAALAGQNRVAFVVGEAGQGKTALLQAFVRLAQQTYPDLIVAGGNCNAYTGIGDPYLPFREILELLTGDVEARAVAGTLRREQADRLWQLLPTTVQALIEAGPDLFDTFIPTQALLSRAAAYIPEGAAWLTQLREMAAAKTGQAYETGTQQSALFEQYVKVVQALARQVPLLFFLDDLQWADVGSINLLFHLGRRLTGYRVFIVGAYRPAEVALGRSATGSREMERHPLERVINELQRDFGDIILDLSQADSQAYVTALLDSEPNRLGVSFCQTLYQQTGGHPLFTLELLRGMQERGDLVQDEAGYWVEQPSLDWTTLPARVEGAIGERISRLAAPLRELLQVASVEGEEFTAEVVAQVLNTGERELVGQLSRDLDKTHHLVQVLGIKREGSLRLSRYRFRHILIQRYLYKSLDEVERAYLNEAVGNALERLYSEQTEQVAGQLARHFQEAGILEKSVGYLLQAGTRARRLSANEEAIAHYSQALMLLETLPDTTERSQQELDVRIAMGPALMVIKGHSAPEVEKTYARAYELCQQIGEPSKLFPALWGLWRFNLNRGKLRTAHALGERCLALAQTQQDPELLLEAYIALGTTLVYLGNFIGANEYFEQGKVLYAPQQHRLLPFLYGGFDPKVYCSSYEPAFLLWMRGYPDQALRQSREVLNLARELSHPYSLVFALFFVTVHFQFRRDGQTTQNLAEEAIALCNEQGISTFLGVSIALRGWALIEQGQEEGLAQLRQGLVIYQTTEAGLFMPYFLALLAEVYLKLGQIDEGLTTLTEAMVLVTDTDERFWEAEIYRLKGELLLQQRAMSETQTEALSPADCFLKAIEIARQQGARVLELRAVMSLCRLWQSQGKVEAARTSLAEIYGWFTQGFDTVDLREAEALLRELGGEVKRKSEAGLSSTLLLPHTSISLPHLSSQPVSSLDWDLKQQIRFCTSSDGVRIAYATVGQGPVFVKAANWLSHLEFDWNSPVWRHWLTGLARHYTLVRYDERGCGLSDWDVDDFSLQAWVQDLETVVDTLGLDRFPLLGISQGGPVALAYAVRHPEKVSHLILYGTYARGRLKRNPTPEQLEEMETLFKLMKIGWGRDNPAFRQVFTTLFIPEGTAEQLRWFNDLQRISASPENAIKFRTTFSQLDVQDLAPKVTMPTLVLHALDDALVPFEEGRYLATLIPNARFVPLKSKNHILLEYEPAWQRFLDEIQQFLQQEPREQRSWKTVAIPPLPPADLPLISEQSTPRHNLPAQPTPFVGREHELAEIRELLAQPTCRLLTLLGPGGIGKTRLSLETASHLVAVFSHGVYFVPLAPLNSAEPMVSILAESVGFHFYGASEPKQQLLDYLRQKQMLLVIDNFEHLLAGAELVKEILETAPQVKILVTSRERLNLSGETIYTLSGMAFPEQDVPESTLEFDAVKLLIQQARLVRPNFEPQVADLSEITRICQLTQGMPLALVLAMSWLGVLSLKEIAAEIGQSLDFLETKMQDVPERQRSVRAAFDYSWKRLSAEDQHIFMKLSVFRGGFTRQAAQMVAGAGLQTLRTLVNKSFISINRKDRYEIHELLRQYAAEQLEASSEVDWIRDLHSDYYLNGLHQREAELKGRKQLAALTEIEADVENLRAAWGWAVQRKNEVILNRASEGLHLFFYLSSRFQEGAQFFRLAREGLASSLEDHSHPLWGQILIRLALMQSHFLTAHEDIEADIARSLAIAKQNDDQAEIALCFLTSGYYTVYAARDPARAMEFFQQSLTYYHALNDRFYITQVFLWIGYCHGNTTGLDNFHKYQRQALELARASGDKAHESYALNHLSAGAFCAGDYAAAERYCREALAIANEMNRDQAVAHSKTQLSLAYFLKGDLEKTRLLAEEGLKRARDINYSTTTAYALALLGLQAGVTGDYSASRQLGEESLATPSTTFGAILGNWNLSIAHYGLQSNEVAWRYMQTMFKLARTATYPAMMTWPLPVTAGLLARQGQPERALELLALASTHPLSPTGWQQQWSLLADLRRDLAVELGQEVYQAAWQRGQSLDLDRVVAELLKGLESTDSLAGELATVPAPKTSSGQIGSRFVQEALIATGGMGEVYLGRDTITGQQVAIKRLKPELVTHNPEAVKRLVREGEILSQLNHPNIVKVLATLETEGQPLIVMEYVPGGSLRDLLDKQPQLPLDQVLNIGLELADALARVHHLGIIHRDLKPANILLAKDGTPRLSDFGVAYLAPQETRLTQVGAILGTTAYLSPEAWRGEELDARSDIWSFGAVLYEMLAGRPPFAAEQAIAIMTAILNDPLPQLFQFRPDAPPALVELIKHMLVKERDRRLDSMRQVAAGLEIIRRIDL